MSDGMKMALTQRKQREDYKKHQNGKMEMIKKISPENHIRYCKILLYRQEAR